MADHEREVKHWLENEGFAKYKEARELTEEQSKKDPENDPFKSRYAARNILNDLKSMLDSFENGGENANSCTFYKAALELRLGVNYAETEELSTGEEHFSHCLYMLKEVHLDPQCASVFLNVLNQIGILWSRRNDGTKAKEFLKQAEKQYHKYRQDVGGYPYGQHELFQEESLSEHEREAEFESAFTHTLYYLAQVEEGLGNSELSAKYCHTTLLRQLETKQYDPVDWALNCATLSQYYITKDDYIMARHCLACATVVFKEAEESETINPLYSPEEDDGGEYFRQLRERLPQKRADIERCWTKYCLELLKSSRDKLLQQLDTNQETDQGGEGRDEERTNYQREDQREAQSQPEGAEGGENHNEAEVSDISLEVEEQAEVSDDVEKNPLRFLSLEVTSYEQNVTDQLVNNFEEFTEMYRMRENLMIMKLLLPLALYTYEGPVSKTAAREVFLAGQKWVSQSKEFYVLDGHVTDYIAIIQDKSQFFKVLAFFENDFERRCKMHKRRIDMLNEILSELNPQHYLSYCRQLMFEIAECYSDMVDLKTAIINESGTPQPHAIKKINILVNLSIKHYQSFIDSMKHKEKLPEKFEDDIVRPALVAHFCIARLYSKLLTTDRLMKVENLKKSCEMYEWIVQYCDSHPDMPKIFEEELELCREMVQLLPVKMEKVMRE